MFLHKRPVAVEVAAFRSFADLAAQNKGLAVLIEQQGHAPDIDAVAPATPRLAPVSGPTNDVTDAHVDLSSDFVISSRVRGKMHKKGPCNSGAMRCVWA
jgi:hypothetical protein